MSESSSSKIYNCFIMQLYKLVNVKVVVRLGIKSISMLDRRRIFIYDYKQSRFWGEGPEETISDEKVRQFHEKSKTNKLYS